jgi:hypothetical protein
MLREGGASDRAIAKRFGVDPAAIRTLRAELVAQGVKVARPTRGRPRKGAPSLDAAYLAAVEYVLEFKRQGFPEAMSIEMSLALDFYFSEHARAFPRNSEPARILKLIGKTRSGVAIALIARIFGFAGTAEEPREEIELGARGAREGIRYESGKGKRIAYEEARWRAASWESCGEFVRHRLLGIEPPAILEEQRDGSYRIRKGWQKVQAADRKESAKMGGKLRRTLRATLPLLKQHGHNPSDLRDLLAMRQSPRRGA